MFDTIHSSSVDLMLEIPEHISSSLKDDSILDEIKHEDALDKFDDYEFLNLIRSEIIDLTEKDDDDKDKIAQQLPYAPVKQRIFSWILRSLGWRYFHNVTAGEYLEDIDIDESAKVVSDEDELVEEAGAGKGEARDATLEEILTIEKEEISQIFRVAKRYFLTDLVHKIRKRFFKSNVVIGFDIGTQNVKYTQIRRDKGKNILDRYRMQEIGIKSNDSNEIIRSKTALAIQKIIPHDILPIADVSVSFSRLPVFMKTEKLPSMDKKELHQAVMFRAQKLVPETIKNPEITYEIIEKSESKEESMLLIRVYIIDKTELSGWIQVLNECGIIPEKITLPHMSIQENLRKFFPAALKEGVVVFDFGGEHSQLTFADKGSIKLVREIETGVSDFLNALTGTIHLEDRTIEVNRELAEELLRTYGISDKNSIGYTKEKIPIARIGILLFQTVEKLVHELHRSIDFYRSNFNNVSIESILVTGGGSEIINLFDLLQNQFGIPVKEFSYLQKLTIGRDISELDQLVQDANLLCGSVGLALDSTNELNLLSKKDQQRKLMNLAALGIAVTFVTMLAIILNISIGLGSDYSNILSLQQDANRELRSRQPRRSEYATLLNQVSNASNLQILIEEQLGSKEENDSIENILKLLSLYNYSDKIIINSIVINERMLENISAGNTIQTILAPRSIILKGKTLAENINNSIVEYILYLKGIPYFDRVEKQSYEGEDFNDQRYFQISLYLKGTPKNGNK
ncbi:pilus assembly protein PilM [candidate division KSB1 bacterium]|nr:pilus assembly protein PilM [candidate division KSB1 bacterium]